MRFVVPGPNVKLLGKAIHCLARVGDEVYLEPTHESLALRTVNSSRSAYATFNFGQSFFSVIELTKSKKVVLEEDRCKVMVRSLLLAFRSLSVLERTVDSCVLETGQDKLLVSLYCRHSITKQVNLGLVECETLRAVYDTKKCTNMWIIQAKVMQEANANFLSTQEEVTMYVESDIFKMKNYEENLEDQKKVHTQLSMEPGEFDQFNIKDEASVTFCLKELRSLLMFAECLDLPICAKFSQGGEPMVLTVSQGQTISCTYVLATLGDQTTNPTSIRRASSYIPMRQGRVESTQKDTFPLVSTSCPLLTPNVSTIPNLLPPVNTSFERPGDINFHEESPPNKRKNFLFRRCFEATFDPESFPGCEKVLAPDSDEEM